MNKKIIYKYVPINKFTIGLIIKQKQWVSDPKKFNDPFEFVKRPISRLLIGEGLKLLSKEEIQLQLQMEKEINGFGVACFSKTCDNILLWSHYADNHEGICLGFEINDGQENFYDVVYQNHIEVFNHKDCQVTYKENAIKLMTTKGSDWQYEQEIRQIFPKKSFETDYPGKLTEVIFGCKCLNTDVDLIWKLVYNIYCDEITFSKMSKQSHSYQLMKSSHNNAGGNKEIPTDFFDK